jgi:hypothetical protein
MEKPSRWNGQTSAQISGVVHVASAENVERLLGGMGDVAVCASLSEKHTSRFSLSARLSSAMQRFAG